MDSTLAQTLAIGLAAMLSGCVTVEEPAPPPGYRPLTATEGRALVARLLPESVKERSGWATDIYAAFTALDLTPTPENICAAIAVTEQESGFQVDPVVPGLAGIARKEIDRRRERAGIPRFALDAALALPSSNGKSYGERLDAARTELQLSEIYEDFIDSIASPTSTRASTRAGMRRSRAASRRRPAFRSSSTATFCATSTENPPSSPAAPSSPFGCRHGDSTSPDADIRHDLELGKDPAFAKSRVYVRMFALVDRLSGKPVPRAVLPQIPLHSPKITRNLTSDWFANRVEGRYRTCLGRMHA